MIAAEALLDAYINANILFCIGFVLWFLVRCTMRLVGYGDAHGTQLRLLNSVFIAIILAPFFALAFNSIQSSGFAKNVEVNLSDLVVAYYLNGGLEMKASEFERLILTRDTFTLNILNGTGFLAQAVVIVFLVATLVGVGRLGYSVFCLWRIVSEGYTWRSMGRLRIKLSDQTLVPFSTRGFWKYYIVVPSHMLIKNEELKVSLAHEFQHIRQGDLEWEVLLEALKPIFFLNPAFHAWKKQVEYLRELNCDNAVLSRGLISARAYCETLLSVCQNTLRRDRNFVIAVPKVTLVTADREALREGRKSFLEQRILSVLSRRKLVRQRLVFAAIVVPLVVAVTLATLAIQRPGDWSQDRLMLSTVVNLDRLDEINRLSTFGRIRN